MTTIEIIDRLCAVTTMLDGESGKKLAEKRDAAYSELDLLELNLRPLVPFTCGKEEEADE